MTLSGVFPPIPTSFDPATGDVDHRAMDANVRRWMTTGLTGVLALGSNGEAALLDEDEGDAIVTTVRGAMPPGRTLLVGTGRESTRATIAACKRAAAGGADAVLVRAPSYFKSQMSADALLMHYRAVADASPVPVLLYNLPGVVGFSLSTAVVAALAAHPNIRGIKETSNDLERLGEFAAGAPETFSVLIGWAPVAYPAFGSGATGAILAVANVMPDATVALFEHARAGRHAEALALQRALTPLAQLVTAVYGVAGLKMAMTLEGYQGGPVRPPLRPAPVRAKDEIAAAIAVVKAVMAAEVRS